MSLLNLKKFGTLAACVGLLALVAAQGCSSDDTQATPSHAGSGGKSAASGGGEDKGGSGSKAGEGNNGGAAGNPDEATGGVAGEDGEGGMGGEPSVDPSCVGKDGCYSCEPKTNTQFLNACVEGGCPATFDNSKLTKLNLVGTL
ncbi:MAG TPA: hypothetical protein VER96_31195 [Polyangiaceae bacterium]|nr:hypothetical protein [Polyangiaceae bacterium]